MWLFNNLFKINNNNNMIDYPKKGFDFNYISDNCIYIRNNKNWNKENINNCLRILKDCAKLINTTKNPKVFFERYLLAISILNELIPIEKKLNLKGDKPSQIKKQFYEKEINTVNDFIYRFYNETILKISTLKTQKSKLLRINEFCLALNNYKQYLSTDSINVYNTLCLNFTKDKSTTI